MSNDFNNPNPYATSQNPGAPMFPTGGQPTKPQSMIVFGILNLIFGVFGILGLIAFVVQLAVPMQQPDNPIQEIMEQPTMKVLTIASQVATAVLTVIELISGIGLINGKGYGRIWAIRYAIGAIVLVLVVSVINIVFISLPLLAKAGEMPEGPEKIGVIAGASALFAQPVCGLIYPVLLLIFMKRASIKNYLQSVGEPL